MQPDNSRMVHEVAVFGVSVDPATRCAHYHGPRDIIALRFPCCGKYFPCFECHTALADHPPERWPVAEHDQEAVLCGACGHRLTVTEYLRCNATCPACHSAFNPCCARHHHLYFEL